VTLHVSNCFSIGINPLLKLAADLNHSHGYTIELPLQSLEDLSPRIQVYM